MNGIDIAILAIMGGSVLMGLVRGFTREVLGLFTWACSASATYFFLPAAGGIARAHIANPMIADTLTGIVLFIISLIIFSIITNMIASFVRGSTLGGIDRSLGLGFGIFRGALLLCVAEIIFSAFTPRAAQSPSIQNARFTDLVRRGGDTLLTMIPHNFQTYLQNISSKAADPKQVNKKITEQLTEQASRQAQEMFAPLNNGANNTPDAPVAATGQQPASPFPPHDMAFGEIIPHTGSQNIPTAKTVQVPTNSPPVEDPQKTVESLANLRPQSTERGKNDDYDPRQRRDMDRLFQTAQG